MPFSWTNLNGNDSNVSAKSDTTNFNNVVVLCSQYELPYIRFRMRGLASYNEPSSGRCYKQAAPTSVHYNISPLHNHEQ